MPQSAITLHVVIKRIHCTHKHMFSAGAQHHIVTLHTTSRALNLVQRAATSFFLNKQRATRLQIMIRTHVEVLCSGWDKYKRACKSMPACQTSVLRRQMSSSMRLRSSHALEDKRLAPPLIQATQGACPEVHGRYEVCSMMTGQRQTVAKRVAYVWGRGRQASS